MIIRSLILCFFIAVNSPGAESWDLRILEKSVVFLTHTQPKAVSDFALGTGFLVSSNGAIMTVDHHVANEETGVVYEKLFAYHESRWIQLKVHHRFRTGLGNGRDIAILKPVGLALVANYLKIGGDVQMGTEVAIAGFPKAFGDEVITHPLFRRGVVSSTKLKHKSGIPILVLDMTSVFGYSGAPVVNLQSGNVVAVFFGGLNNPQSSDFSLAAPVSVDDLSFLPNSHERAQPTRTR